MSTVNSRFQVGDFRFDRTKRASCQFCSCDTVGCFSNGVSSIPCCPACRDSGKARDFIMNLISSGADVNAAIPVPVYVPRPESAPVRSRRKNEVQILEVMPDFVPFPGAEIVRMEVGYLDVTGQFVSVKELPVPQAEDYD